MFPKYPESRDPACTSHCIDIRQGAAALQFVLPYKPGVHIEPTVQQPAKQQHSHKVAWLSMTDTLTSEATWQQHAYP